MKNKMRWACMTAVGVGAIGMALCGVLPLHFVISVSVMNAWVVWYTTK